MSDEYSESMTTTTNSPNILKRQRSPSPQNVVVILPDESCFAYATPGPKKARAEAKNCWTQAQTDALIEEYRENHVLLEKSEVNKVPIWETIAANISNKFDTTFTGDNCMLKVRSLKSSYKKVEFSNRTEASKYKWSPYKVLHELFKDSVKEPESRHFSSAPTIFNDTPQLRPTIVGLEQPTIKIITEPTAVLSTINPTAAQQDLHFPVWFKQFFQVYRKNEDTKIALLTKIKNNMAVMADRQCKALEKLNEHLGKISGNSG